MEEELPQLKILIINYEFPPVGGGASNASFFVSKELAKIGHEVTVLTSLFKNLPESQMSEGFRILRVQAFRKKISTGTMSEMLMFLINGWRFLRKMPESITFDMSVAFFTIPSGILSWYLKWKYGVPYITLLRGGDVPGIHGLGLMTTLMHTILKPLTVFIWKQSDRVIANSKGLMTLAKHSWNGAIDIITNGVDTDFFKPTLKTHEKGTQLLYVGRLSSEKGVNVLLDLVAGLDTKEPWRFLIVGDGPDRIKLENKVMAVTTLQDRVRFAGWTKKDKLLQMYGESDVFLLASYGEGMSNVILEAMACGLPIVATRVAGSDELVKDGQNGFLFNIGDGNKARDILSRLISDPIERSRLGQRSRELAKEKNWATTALNIIRKEV